MLLDQYPEVLSCIQSGALSVASGKNADPVWDTTYIKEHLSRRTVAEQDEVLLVLSDLARLNPAGIDQISYDKISRLMRTFPEIVNVWNHHGAVYKNASANGILAVLETHRNPLRLFRLISTCNDSWEFFRTMGTLLYARVWRDTHNQADLEKVVSDDIELITDETIDKSKMACYGTFGSFAARWAECAFPVLHVARGPATDLAFTEASAAIPVCLPWPAAAVALPPGLITLDGKDQRFVGLFTSDSFPVFLLGPERVKRTRQRVTIGAKGESLSSFLSDSGSWVEHVGNSNDARATLTAMRITAGLLRILEHKPPEAKISRASGARRISEDPGHREVEIWFKSTIRPNNPEKGERGPVAEYIKRGRTSCAWKFIVRGHWRNQACGKGQAERRLMWIKPHWKGPAGAPIAGHVYNVKEAQNGTKTVQS